MNMTKLRTSRPIPSWVFVFLGVLLFCFPGCWKNENPVDGKKISPKFESATDKALSSEQRKIKTLSESETLIQNLATKMSLVSRAFTAEDVDSTQFASSVSLRGLNKNNFSQLSANSTHKGHDGIGAYFYWPTAEQVDVVPFSKVWQPLLEVKRFEDFQIGVLKGSFVGDGDEQRFEMETKIEGRLGRIDGRIYGAKAYQTLGWKTNNTE